VQIIAGEHRGRRLASPPGRIARPMLGRVREALFSILGERVPGARVLDLFAGSGSLALEALSRGAARARMVERDPRVLQCLRRNAAELGVEEAVEIRRADALSPGSWADPSGPWDLVFLDPPYRLLEEARTRRLVLERLDSLVEEALADGGLAVLHAPRGTPEEGQFGPSLRIERREYGTTALWFTSSGSGQKRISEG